MNSLMIPGANTKGIITLAEAGKFIKAVVMLFIVLATSAAVSRAQSHCTTQPPGSTPQNPFVVTLSPGVTNSYVHSNDTTNCFGNETLHLSTDDIVYQFVLSSPGTVTVSNIGTNFQCAIGIGSLSGTTQTVYAQSITDTVIGGVTKANNQVSALLPAGVYYVVTAALNFDIGNITTNIKLEIPRTGANFTYPIVVGNLTTGSSYNDSENNAPANGFLNDFGQPSDDIYYKFTLTATQSVGIQVTGFDTYVTLLDSKGNIIDYNDDYGPLSNSTDASLQGNLAAGTYYVVAEGKGTNSGFMNVIINASAPTGIPLVNNYIKTNTVRVSGIKSSASVDTMTTSSRAQTVLYFDGLGRPIQQVQTQASPSKRDIVTPMTYDQYGREAVKYLPYVVSTTAPSDGSFKPTAITDQATFYANPAATGWNAPGVDTSSRPYAQTVYDTSPLSRVVQQGFAGYVWQPAVTRSTHSGRTVITTYTSNTAQTDVHKVVHYTAQSAHNDISRYLINAGWYGRDSLYLTITEDENWVPANGKSGSVEQYTDRLGRRVLKRQWLTDNIPLSTYYVYDDIGNLSFVLPPGANPDSTGNISQALLNGYCYQYQYDGRRRMIAKKVPGKGWEYMVYNKLDQVIATQDSVQRMKTPQQVFYTKYDGQGRTIITGYYTIPNSTVGKNYRDSLQAIATAQTTLWETKSSGGTYSNSSMPTANAIPLIYSYYDDYNISGLPAGYTLSTEVSTMTRGLPTASLTAVINTTADKLWDVHYYDDLGRETKLYKQHYLGGHTSYSTNNYELYTMAYNFANQLDTIVRYHYTTANLTVPQMTIGNSYDYDQVGRKRHIGEQLFGKTNVAQAGVYISFIDYNEIGQMAYKHLYFAPGMSGYLTDVQYSYNERGWLASITPTGGIANFAEILYFNKPPKTGAVPQYNGNIAQFNYNSPKLDSVNLQAQTYMNGEDFFYDSLNRLLKSNANLRMNNEQVAYDNMGNIDTLVRAGYTQNASYLGTLVYKYASQSNQLDTVKNGSNTLKAFTYDGNGNATKTDTNKTIVYNMFNLPMQVNLPGSMLATYYYDAAGNKLRDVSKAGGTWDYEDGIVYKNGQVQFIQTDEGRATLSSDSITYNYITELKDYLGNVRASYDNGGTGGTARLIQENDFFPFGLTTSYWDINSKNRYLYNNKEQQIDLTEQYDYGARFYDPVIARWTSVDPLATNHFNMSPYNYVMDNPLLYNDVLGLDTGKIKPQPPNPVLINHMLKEVDIVERGKGGLVNRLQPGVIFNFHGYHYKHIIRKDPDDPSVRTFYRVVGAIPLLGVPWVRLGAAALEATGLITVTETSDLMLTSSEMGEIIGWGTGQATAEAGAEAVAQTESVTANLTEEEVERFQREGLTKDWVEKQLASYNKALSNPIKAQSNVNLLPRRALMIKILELWPK